MASSTTIKGYIEELEQLVYELRTVSPGEVVDYNGTKYQAGDVEKVKRDIQWWELRLDKALADEGEGEGNKSYFHRAEGLL